MNRGALYSIVAAALGVLALVPAAQAAVSFNPAQQFAASAPWWSATGDFNADGIADIVTASNSTNVVSVLLGNGDGTLQAPKDTPATTSNLNAVAAGDVNGDGRADVVAARNGNPGSMLVYIGNGDGTLGTPTAYAAGAFPQDVVIARLNGDTAPDIAVANQTSHNFSIYLNNGNGTFSAAPTVTDANGNEFLGIGAADFDGDGNTDLAAGGLNGTNPGVYFIPGTGTGTFGTPVALGGAGAQKPVAGDLNGDGRPDIAAGRSGVGDVAIITRTATGFAPFTTFDPDGPTGNANARIALADLDGDGILDLAVPNTVGPQANKVSVAVGHGDATFETTSNEAVTSFPRQVVVADLNRDGNPDLVTSNSGGGNVSVLTAIGPTVVFTPTVAFGNQPPHVASAEQAITVRNDGAPRLRPGAVALGGANPGEFSISSNNCTSANLPVGGTCRVGVRFTPNGLGTRSATVSIASNGAGAPHVVQLTGVGALLPGACANTLNGTAAADVLNGTPLGDNIFGRGGNDVLNGLAGNDCLDGGTGADRLNGGDGSDVLAGRSGNDVESGGRGNDTLGGGGGRDRLSGGARNDTLNGSTGNDTLGGGTGNDRLIGGSGNDRLTGGPGRNRYSGGSGNDSINAVNRRVEKVDCGKGRRDRARVDRKDKVKHCEIVRRRRR